MCTTHKNFREVVGYHTLLECVGNQCERLFQGKEQPEAYFGEHCHELFEELVVGKKVRLLCALFLSLCLFRVLSLHFLSGTSLSHAFFLSSCPCLSMSLSSYLSVLFAVSLSLALNFALPLSLALLLATFPSLGLPPSRTLPLTLSLAFF